MYVQVTTNERLVKYFFYKGKMAQAIFALSLDWLRQEFVTQGSSNHPMNSFGMCLSFFQLIPMLVAQCVNKSPGASIYWRTQEQTDLYFHLKNVCISLKHIVLCLSIGS